MRIVFWHNCLSPHQLPYVKHLKDDGRVDEVDFVAPVALEEERLKMGWGADLGHLKDARVNLVLAPDDDAIQALLTKRTSDTWHVFSGIRADAFVFKCLRMSMAYDLRRVMVSERPNTYDFKHNINNAKPYWMHRLRFWLQDRKYARGIEKVFAMGYEAVGYFRSVNKWDVYPFCYCTEPADGAAVPVGQAAKTKFIFVGSLSHRKSPMSISCGMERCVGRNTSFGGQVVFVGDGVCRPKMEEYAKAHHLEERMQFVGFKPQSEIPNWMAQNDTLILSSVYDGWGAVVNEALQAGLYVIVSDACGASDLMADRRIGQVFRHGNDKELADLMLYCDSNIDVIRRDRDYRKKWAEEHISGRVVAKYFVDCLCGENDYFLY